MKKFNVNGFLAIRLFALFVILLLSCDLQANPTGGSVAAGSANINTVPGTVTVNQFSNAAVINWQSFSINSGELTQFLQPNSSSVVLNRVLGGQTSIINGSLNANGQVFLLNGNGILVGAGGTVNTAGFLASTRDISDADFLAGNLHFTGSNGAGVQNLGKLTALGGDVILIGHTVDNEGVINAPNGHVGLAAGDDVLISQIGNEHVFINAVNNPVSGSGQTGVNNSGSISAVTAELKAANGNIYALAVNNTGIIRATGTGMVGGHLWFISDSGTVQNSGTLDASNTKAGGKGGAIVLKSAKGTAINSGQLLAKGGQGGAGGTVDISGYGIQIGGTVDLTAAGGTTGMLTIDPATLTVVTGTVGSPSTVTSSNFTYDGGTNTDTNNTVTTDDTIDPTTVESLLTSANVTLNADNNVTITDGVTWTSANTLTISTNIPGSTVAINAALTGTNGTLVIDTTKSTDIITPGAGGAIDVKNFILQSGTWTQAPAGIPAAFTVSNDFQIQSNGTFLRSQGGNGTASTPYQIFDLYGLEGLSTISGSNYYKLDQLTQCQRHQCLEQRPGLSADRQQHHSFYR